MNINIKATNMELTDAIAGYVNKRLEAIEKLTQDKSFIGQVEVARTTGHHQKGEVYRAEIDLSIDGKRFFAHSEKEDLYVAIDDAKEQIIRIVTHTKDRRQTLYKRGAVSIKKMLKGLSKRNPFTSKY